MYERGDEVMTPVGQPGKFQFESEEHYHIDMGMYLVKYNKDDIDLLNIGMPYCGKLDPEDL